jgi:N-acetylmuramic acid 6-phosphate (MurNAc-6-P) etherase
MRETRRDVDCVICRAASRRKPLVLVVLVLAAAASCVARSATWIFRHRSRGELAQTARASTGGGDVMRGTQRDMDFVIGRAASWRRPLVLVLAAVASCMPRGTTWIASSVTRRAGASREANTAI